MTSGSRQMDEAFFRTQRDAIRAGVASQMGMDGGVFLGERLMIAARPEPPPWPYFLFGATFGVGTALAVREDYVEWLRANEPGKHFRALRADFMVALAREGERRGERLMPVTGGIGWALGEAPRERSVEGVTLGRITKDEMEELRPGGVFHNGIGSVDGADGRAHRNNFGIAARDERSSLLAVAGVFDTSTLKEIGVDVVNEARGRGLARAVVAAAAREILELGSVPYYACADTNIRSQRTALACGFVPVCSTTSVFAI